VVVISLAPNPVKDQLLIYSNGIEQSASHDIPILMWNILDFTGAIVDRGEFVGDDQLSIDVSRLVPQIYLLRVSGSNGIITVQRFLKQD
jgi:hypothetical protein